MPKAVCPAYRSLFKNGDQIGAHMRLTARIVCCPSLLFHCFSNVIGYIETDAHGVVLVLPSASFNVNATLQAGRENCTAFHAVPAMLVELFDLFDSGATSYQGLGTLCIGVVSGRSVPLELMELMQNMLNMSELTICYGVTESSPISVPTAVHDPRQPD